MRFYIPGGSRSFQLRHFLPDLGKSDSRDRGFPTRKKMVNLYFSNFISKKDEICLSINPSWVLKPPKGYIPTNSHLLKNII